MLVMKQTIKLRLETFLMVFYKVQSLRQLCKVHITAKNNKTEICLKFDEKFARPMVFEESFTTPYWPSKSLFVIYLCASFNKAHTKRLSVWKNGLNHNHVSK